MKKTTRLSFDDVIRDFKASDSRCRKLMISVLATQIQDYLRAKEITEHLEDAHYVAISKRRDKKTGREQRMTSTLTRGLAAQSYIFDDTWDSENYVFGFKFICSYIELDPTKFREAIRDLKREDIRDARLRAKSY